MKISQILMLLMLLLLSITANAQESLKEYYKYYKVGLIPQLSDFLTLTEHEAALDSKLSSTMLSLEMSLDSNLTAEEDSTLREYLREDYKFKRLVDNRARVLALPVKNGNENLIIDTVNISKGVRIPFCDCRYHNDTLSVNMFLGFVGGIGFIVEISNNEFKGAYYAKADGSEIYTTDTTEQLSDFLWVENEYQSLVLLQKPEFKSSETITGYLQFTTNPFYVLDKDENYKDVLKKESLTGKIYFTCLINKI